MVTTFVPTRKSSQQASHDVVLFLVLQAGQIVPTPGVTRARDGLRIGREVNGAEGICIASDHMLSRVHATLHRRDTGFFVVDSSSNGTFVNGARCAETMLRDRDVLRVGQSVFVVRQVPERPGADGSSSALLGVSTEAKKLRATLHLMAPTSSTVLLLGETGSGKEVAARAVHDLSGRKGPFLALNCAAIPETLAEAQLFGHTQGAFTGARAASPGAFRSAQNGTLFLDEVGELPAAVQAKLLRVLETQDVTPVGSTESVRFDVRVVCATHRELVRQTAQGGFRGDLYARIAELVIRLPPLRDRREDVLLLLFAFLGVGPLPPFDAELAERLLLHPWPFNVRELRKLGAQLALHRGDELLVVDLIVDRLQETAGMLAETDAPRSAAPTSSPFTTPIRVSEPASPSRAMPAGSDVARGMPMRDELVALLERHQGNIVRVARETGRSRKSVYRWLEHHGLQTGDFRADDDAKDGDD